MLEVRQSALIREMREIDAAVAAIESSLNSPLVHALSLHAAAVKRIAGLNQKKGALEKHLTVLRGETIATRTRAKLATQLAENLDSIEARKEGERESLETTTLMKASSLRQASDG